MQKTINQLMTKEVIVIDFNTKFSRIIEFFHEFHMNHLPVVYNDKLVGMISLRVWLVNNNPNPRILEGSEDLRGIQDRDQKRDIQDRDN